MTDKKYTGFLQCLEIVDYASAINGEPYDLEVYSQHYRLPKSGMSPLIESGGGTYKYDFGKNEVVLVSAEDGKEIIRRQVDPKVFARSEWKWIRNLREEARLRLGLDEY